MNRSRVQQPITDPDAIVDALRALWNAGGPQDKYTQFIGNGRTTRPLAETRHGAPGPEGVANPYWSIARQLPHTVDRGIPDVLGWSGQLDGLPVSREMLTHTYSFAIPSPGDIEFLVTMLDGRKVIEVGAGTGYWAWQLSQQGVDVVAYDSHLWADEGRIASGIQYHPVPQGSVEKISEHPDRVLMLCWPDYNTPFADEALKAFTGDVLIYIGEGWGGCTGDDAFGGRLSREWGDPESSPSHVNFHGIHSHVGVYRRR